MNGTTIVSPGVQRAAVAPEPLDDAGARLRDDPDRPRRDEQREQRRATTSDDQRSHGCSAPIHRVTSAVAPLISMTCTRVARLDDLVLVVGARGPDLAVELHAADALVVGDPLEHDRGPADQRGGAGADLRRACWRWRRAIGRTTPKSRAVSDGEHDARRSASPRRASATSAAADRADRERAQEEAAVSRSRRRRARPRRSARAPRRPLNVRGYSRAETPDGPAGCVRSLTRGLDERAREVVGVERAQVLERLADADQLHRDARARRRSPARCRPSRCRRAS